MKTAIDVLAVPVIVTAAFVAWRVRNHAVRLAAELASALVFLTFSAEDMPHHPISGWIEAALAAAFTVAAALEIARSTSSKTATKEN